MGIEKADYFISWEGAEISEAQENYTEKLILLPKILFGNTMYHVMKKLMMNYGYLQEMVKLGVIYQEKK